MVYTSMKESLIGSLRDAFVKKHPDIAFDYYSAGAGKLMAKIATERQSGKMAVDVLWHSEVPDFYKLKQDGLLEQYISPEAKYVKSPVKDPESYFTPARLGTLGIAYNTKKLLEGMTGKFPPKEWKDILDPRFKGGFAIANPALSGTAFVSVAMMVNTMGWEYFEKLAKNGAIMGQGSGQVVDDTASGDLMATLAVDYITIERSRKAPILLDVPRGDARHAQPGDDHEGNSEPQGRREIRRFSAFKGRSDDTHGKRNASIRSDVPMPRDGAGPGGSGGQTGNEAGLRQDNE